MHQRSVLRRRLGDDALSESAQAAERAERIAVAQSAAAGVGESKEADSAPDSDSSSPPIPLSASGTRSVLYRPLVRPAGFCIQIACMAEYQSTSPDELRCADYALGLADADLLSLAAREALALEADAAAEATERLAHRRAVYTDLSPAHVDSWREERERWKGERAYAREEHRMWEADERQVRPFAPSANPTASANDARQSRFAALLSASSLPNALVALVIDYATPPHAYVRPHATWTTTLSAVIGRNGHRRNGPAKMHATVRLPPGARAVALVMTIRAQLVYPREWRVTVRGENKDPSAAAAASAATSIELCRPAVRGVDRAATMQSRLILLPHSIGNVSSLQLESDYAAQVAECTLFYALDETSEGRDENGTSAMLSSAHEIPNAEALESGWRHCRKCACLWRPLPANGDGDASSSRKGTCTLGNRDDGHTEHDSAWYDLVCDRGEADVHTQAGWKQCEKCCVLFFQTDSSDSTEVLCVTGGAHTPSAASYRLHCAPPDAPAVIGGEKGWRVCVQCFALVWSDAGHCPASGAGALGRHVLGGGTFELIYRLPHIEATESLRCCGQCDAIFSPSRTNRCTASRPHSEVSSDYYTLHDSDNVVAGSAYQGSFRSCAHCAVLFDSALDNTACPAAAEAGGGHVALAVLPPHSLRADSSSQHVCSKCGAAFSHHARAWEHSVCPRGGAHAAAVGREGAPLSRRRFIGSTSVVASFWEKAGQGSGLPMMFGPRDHGLD